MNLTHDGHDGFADAPPPKKRARTEPKSESAGPIQPPPSAPSQAPGVASASASTEATRLAVGDVFSDESAVVAAVSSFAALVQPPMRYRKEYTQAQPNALGERGARFRCVKAGGQSRCRWAVQTRVQPAGGLFVGVRATSLIRQRREPDSICALRTRRLPSCASAASPQQGHGACRRRGRRGRERRRSVGSGAAEPGADERAGGCSRTADTVALARRAGRSRGPARQAASRPAAHCRRAARGGRRQRRRPAGPQAVRLGRLCGEVVSSRVKPFQSVLLARVKSILSA